MLQVCQLHGYVELQRGGAVQVWNDADAPRLVFIVDAWHPELQTQQQRLDALEPTGKRRYLDLLRREEMGLGPPAEEDLVAERRTRVVF